MKLNASHISLISRNFSILIIMCALAIFSACQQNGETEQTAATTTPEPTETVEPVTAVCIWEGASVRALPSRKGKLISTIALGEQLLWTGETVLDSASAGKPLEFYKVRLSDDKEGWTSAYLLVANATTGAILQKSFIYRRPDLLTVTEEAFDPMDMVAISQREDDWLEVTGNRRKKKGWIRTQGVSEKPEDVAVAIIATKALATNNEEKRREKLKAIVANPAFASSAFIQDIHIILNPPEPGDFNSSGSDTSAVDM